ncbi:hypothetical protein [Adhaeribacter pallidiroseus]|uniref:Uncharacterized protein n=1 Tax=Adhaeribacter pallidiroseus TaxID=2072847 RepID=A0A369QHW4_9BACT|nr:hypothetical protein [Adhaeribacter pallidiroseus]RDC62877.1 hypothetical protein AHMF7616_01476 [Adhaeribacter pallidiroseus]
MEKNQFVVDLGDLELSPEQSKSLNAAIHKAVAGELANIGTANQVALFPINDLSDIDRKTIFGKGGLINGIIIRDFKKENLKDLLQSKIRKQGEL